jgi:hypothetical protein
MNRFDVCAAFNLYSVLWGGDGAPYENRIQWRLSRIGYRPAPSEEYLSGLSPDARSTYARLVRERQAAHVATARLLRRANGRLGPIGGQPYDVVRHAFRKAIHCYLPEG